MEEKTGKRMPSTRQSLLSNVVSGGESKKNKSDSLNFSNGFTYQNQNLDQVHTSADDVKKMNDEKVEKFLGQSIPKKEKTDKEIENFTKSLDRMQLSWINKNQENFSTNAMIEYINNRKSWKNPFAEGTGMFETKSNYLSSLGENPWEAGGKLTLGVLGWELGGWGVENLGKGIYKWNTPPTGTDVDKRHIDNTNPKINSKIQKTMDEYANKIESLRAAGASEEEIAPYQRAYDRLAEQYQSHDTQKRPTTVEYANEQGYAGTDLSIADKARVDKETNRITEIEPKMAMSKQKVRFTDIIDSLTREDLGVSPEAWDNEYKPIIDELKEYYANEDELSLLELQDRNNEIGKEIKYAQTNEDVTSPKTNVKSRLKDKIKETISAKLEEEYPGQGLPEKISEYHMQRETEDAFLDRGKALKVKGNKVPKNKYELLKITEEKTRGGFRKLGKLLQNTGKIRPSKILSKIKDLVSKGWKTVTNAGKGGAGVIDPIGVAGLLTLIPSTRDAALEYIYSSPEGQAVSIMDEPMNEALNMASWNSASDDERVDILKQSLDYIFDEDFPREDVEYTYMKWKGDSNGKIKPKFEDGYMWFVGDSGEPVPDFVLNEEEETEKENSRLNETVYKTLYSDPNTTDEMRIKLIMDRYLVSEDEAKRMLENMTAGGEYNKPVSMPRTRKNKFGNYIKNGQVDKYTGEGGSMRA